MGGESYKVSVTLSVTLGSNGAYSQLFGFNGFNGLGSPLRLEVLVGQPVEVRVFLTAPLQN